VNLGNMHQAGNAIHHLTENPVNMLFSFAILCNHQLDGLRKRLMPLF
jgi:hypothetical protein